VLNNALKGAVVIAESAAGGIIVGGLIEYFSAQCALALLDGGGGDQWCQMMNAWEPYAPAIGLAAALAVGAVASWWYFKRTGQDVHHEA
jgi:hypothetical protein